MYPVTHSGWLVKAFFSRTSSTLRKKKIRRVKINADKANESSEQIITRKRKKYEKRRRRFKGDTTNIFKGSYLQVEQEVIQLRDAFKNVFLALTKKEKALVENALHGSNSKEVLVMDESSNIQITRGIIQCLKSEGKLNDDVINLYLELLKEREKREPTKFLKCHFFNTFFYVKLTGRGNYNYNAVKRWTRHQKIGYNLLECDSILVPIYKFYQQHWCLAIINIKEKKFQYFDSLSGRNHDDSVFNILAQYIKDEAEDKCRKDLDVDKWKREYVENLPKQGNIYDCGVFLIKYADFHTRGMPFNFTQADMPYFRERTAKEILRLRAE
ncbi:putative ubiquitin-like-specific protease 1B [Cryptomeria japonica]|uniref:putative ubiquitin-like-specific protease 1B n=1 Tax=Cryptomeria japonica TaxID=3369 RepID=UPI0025AD3777|nr:putative ubiquitin-like-specific protease 1B [Cryptomeria japonica]